MAKQFDFFSSVKKMTLKTDTSAKLSVLNLGHFYSSKGNLVQPQTSHVLPKIVNNYFVLNPETMPMWMSKQAQISGQLLETYFLK